MSLIVREQHQYAGSERPTDVHHQHTNVVRTHRFINNSYRITYFLCYTFGCLAENPSLFSLGELAGIDSRPHSTYVNTYDY